MLRTWGGILVGALDIEANLDHYSRDREPESRYASFDYCFNYFQTAREQGKLDCLVSGESLQLSCLHLGFYLASWGMFRGSSTLLQHSVRRFIPVVTELVSAPAELWTMDADQYSEDAIQMIMSFRGQLGGTLPGRASDTLVTKVMLGTMGCVPAFDTSFRKGFAVWTFGVKSLRKVGQFYEDNIDVIESHRKQTLDFDTELPTTRRYTRAKVIDMIFVVQGAR